MDFSIKDLEALQELIDPSGESSAYDQFTSGSMLTPGQIGQPKGELAPPNAKINTIVNRKPKKEIWSEEDIHTKARQSGDDRPEPEFEILYQQRVGTEDVYLGLGGRDPSTAYCQDLLVKIQLPGTRREDIGLDVDPQNLKLQAPNFKLNLALPHPVLDKQGSAKWEREKETLVVTLPINKEEIPL